MGINEEIVPLIVSRALAPCVLSLGGPWGVWGRGDFRCVSRVLQAHVLDHPSFLLVFLGHGFVLKLGNYILVDT